MLLLIYAGAQVPAVVQPPQPLGILTSGGSGAAVGGRAERLRAIRERLANRPKKSNVIELPSLSEFAKEIDFPPLPLGAPLAEPELAMMGGQASEDEAVLALLMSDSPAADDQDAVLALLLTA